jgi:hypothetical protein
MFTTLETVGLIVVGLGVLFLTWRTYREYYPKKKQPQDHYYGDRKH